ncbi:MAG TPA: hypothetical protein VGH90_11290 [Chthoniobacteraceae bacterium]
MTVDDPDGGLAGEGGLIDKFVDAAGGFFDRGADYVDFFGGGLIARLRVHGDAAGARDVSRGAFRRLCAGINSDDVGQGNLHAHGAGFDFCGTAVVAAEQERLLESLYDDALTRGKKAGFDRLRRALRLNAEVGLRGGEGVDDGGVRFGAGVTSNLAEAAAGLFFDLSSQRAVLYIGGEAGDFGFQSLLGGVEILFEFGDAFLLPVDPFGLERAALGFRLRQLFASLALDFVHLIAAAMQIRYQIACFA